MPGIVIEQHSEASHETLGESDADVMEGSRQMCQPCYYLLLVALTKV